jgi:hypothetical protein
MIRAFSLRSTLTITLLAMLIALWLPFDQGVSLISGGRLLAHVCLVGVTALVGAWLFAEKADLPAGGSIRSGVIWALGVALYVLLIDGLLLHPLMSPGMKSLLQMPLLPRMAVTMARAFNENVLYRLFLFGGAMAAWRGVLKRPPSLGIVLVLAALAQVVNIYVNVARIDHDPITPAVLAYWLIRYIAPGVAWGWLYWRDGFVTAEVASVGAHVFLQPVYRLVV